VDNTDLDHYVVYRDNHFNFIPTENNILMTVEKSDRAIEDHDVQNGNLYFYRVAAVDESGNESEISECIGCIPSGPSDYNYDLSDAIILQNGYNGYDGVTDGTIWTLYHTGESQQLFNYHWLEIGDYCRDDVGTTVTYYINCDRSFIKFNLEIIAAGVTIDSVWLDVNATSKTGWDSPLYLYRSLQPWNEQATFHTYNGKDNWGAEGSSEPGVDYDPEPVDFLNPSELLIAGWQRFHGENLTNLVREWIGNPSSNYGFFLKKGNDGIRENTSISIYSSESAEEYKYPKLVLFTSTGNTNNKLSKNYKLFQNYPNPFNARTTINFELNKASPVIISIYNLKGQLIETLLNEVKNKGTYSIDWDASRYASGTYIYRLSTDNTIQTKKMTYVK